MNRPLRHLERSGVAVCDYWLGGMDHPMPKAQRARLVGPPSSTSITRAVSDVATIARRRGLDVSFTPPERQNVLADTDAAESFLLPKRSARLKVITHQRGKGTFLPYD
jgi:hypothetical protein